MSDRSMTVTLTELELDIAAHIGIRRRIESVAHRRIDDATKRTPWETDIVGAIGELVVAKFLNIYPDLRLGTFKLPDIGQLQVRATSYAEGCLIVHTYDPPDDLYALVVGVKGQPMSFRVAGCLRGYEAIQPQWFTSKTTGREPQYFVPQAALRPFPTRAEFEAL